MTEQFKDTDLIDVWYGESWEIDKHKDKYLGTAPYYQGASKLVNDYLDSINYKQGYMRWIGPLESGIMIIDYGSHSNFFKLRKAKQHEIFSIHTRR